jgi:hypothetical protein
MKRFIKELALSVGCAATLGAAVGALSSRISSTFKCEKLGKEHLTPVG